MFNDYDAGILKDTKAYKWQDQGIRILYASPKLPPYNITAHSSVPPALVEKIRKAFLDLDINNPQHKSIIKSLDQNYSGFANTNDGEYEIIRNLIAPFKTTN